MLVPHVQQDDSSSMTAKQRNDLSTFFEYVDEIVLSHTDQLPDQENHEEQLTEVAKENVNNFQFIIEPRIIIGNISNEFISKIDPLGYAASVHIEIFAPPPNLA